MKSPDECREAVRQSILDVAPELSLDGLEATTDLQRDLGLDSIDLVNVAGAIAWRTGVEIPDTAFAQLHPFGPLVTFAEHARPED